MSKQISNESLNAVTATEKEMSKAAKNAKKLAKAEKKAAKKALNKNYKLFCKLAKKRAIAINAEAKTEDRLKAACWLVNNGFEAVAITIGKSKDWPIIGGKIHPSIELFSSVLEEYSEKDPTKITKKQFSSQMKPVTVAN